MPFSHGNPRDYFAYRILDEIQKAATRFIEWKEFFSSEGECQEHESADQIRRITLQGVYDEVNLRVRKLTELAIELILFGYTNELQFYKDYLYFSEMFSLMNDQSDRDEFYGYKSENTEVQINDLKSEIRELERGGLDVSKRWYLKKPVPIDKMGKPGYSSFKDKYKKILSYKKADEITLIGKSYRHAYGESDYIHFSHDEKIYVFSEQSLILKIDKVAILMINILTMLNNVLGGVLGDEVKSLPSFSDDVGQKHYLEWTTSKAKPGDYVVIGQDLGVVLEENMSKYGFFSYKIQYVSDPPLPNVKEDSFAVFEIYRLGNKRELGEMVLKCYRQAGFEIEISKIEDLDDKLFNEALVRSFKEVYEELITPQPSVPKHTV